MQIAMEDVRPQPTHRPDQPPEKTSQIPAVAFSNTMGRHGRSPKFRLELPWIKMDDTDIKPAIGGQSLRQRDHLTLSPAVSQVTDEEGKAMAMIHGQSPIL